MSLEDAISAARLDARSAEAARAMHARLPHEPRLADLAETFLRTVDASPSGAVEALRGAQLGAQADVFHLLLALLELPKARARHVADGVPPDVSAATWVDLGVWARHLRKRERRLGLPLEILGWAQSYLRGRLYRFGALQLALAPFDGPVCCLRLPGQATPLVLTAPAVLPEVWDAHEVDPRAGVVTDRVHRVVLAECERLLVPGDPMLEMHIPADAQLTMAGFAESLRAGLRFFGAQKPKGVFGEAWLLDPQVLALVPDHRALRALQQRAQLYPGKIPEAKTVRRLFGPSATRASVEALPREGLSALQRATAAFLDDPARALSAKGGFVLAPLP